MRTNLQYAADCIIFGPFADINQILLVERKNEPFKGSWALPGGFMEENETIEQTADRELKEETGISPSMLQQFFTFTDPNRDPRGRIISTAFWALVGPSRFFLNPEPDSDVTQARWFDLKKLPALAFDHDLIIQKAISTLRREILIEPIIFQIMPKLFTLTQLQKTFEIILDIELDKRNFRKKILSYPFILESSEMDLNSPGRPARYYIFDINEYQIFKNQTNKTIFPVLFA